MSNCKGKITGQQSPRDVEEVIRLLLSDRGSVSSGEVVAATGVTRQAVHYHLARMLAAGELERQGGGRGTRYLRAVRFARRYPLAGLEEHLVWQEILAAVPEVSGASENVRSILGYAFTEMLNNAIDHSQGAEASASLWLRYERIAFEVADDGIGAFRHIREKLRLEDDFAALQELSKGKQTTDPDRHTGEGIFFTSKMVDRFELDAGGLRWVVDNLRRDQAVGESPARRGTRVLCEIGLDSGRTTTEIFDAYADRETMRFTRSTVVVRLFEIGGAFVSRSEARRIASNLERFEEVRLDFSGVQEVGQAFVDELLRVWADRHPQTKLIPVNMAAAVEKMIRRGLPAGLHGPSV